MKLKENDLRGEMMAYRLPPLNTLRLFEASGRHLSFKLAAEELRRKMEEDLAAKGRRPWKAAAPVHFVVLTREDDYHDRYRAPDKLKITGGRELDWPAPYWYVDAGAAAMTLMLAAIDEGLETAIFGVMDLPALHETLGLPDDVRFVAVVTAGYPVDTADEPSRASSVFTERRRPREEVVRWERW